MSRRAFEKLKTAGLVFEAYHVEEHHVGSRLGNRAHDGNRSWHPHVFERPVDRQRRVTVRQRGSAAMVLLSLPYRRELRTMPIRKWLENTKVESEDINGVNKPPRQNLQVELCNNSLALGLVVWYQTPRSSMHMSSNSANSANVL